MISAWWLLLIMPCASSSVCHSLPPGMRAISTTCPLRTNCCARVSTAPGMMERKGWLTMKCTANGCQFNAKGECTKLPKTSCTPTPASAPTPVPEVTYIRLDAAIKAVRGEPCDRASLFGKPVVVVGEAIARLHALHGEDVVPRASKNGLRVADIYWQGYLHGLEQNELNLKVAQATNNRLRNQIQFLRLQLADKAEEADE